MKRKYNYQNEININKEKSLKFKLRIIKWYKKSGRNFKWRNTNEPYNILISELMLQKTDALKVSKVYPIFIKKFPNFLKLKNSNIKTIGKEIELLGLSYRAVRFKKIAKQIMNNFNGKVPKNKEDLQSLYGVGPYITNAVLCFAYKKRLSIVDTNIIRIYNRVFNIGSTKSRPRDDKEIWSFAEKMLPKRNFINYNYALLDFASEICKAKKPQCEKCTIRKICYYQTEVVKNES